MTSADLVFLRFLANDHLERCPTRGSCCDLARAVTTGGFAP